MSNIIFVDFARRASAPDAAARRAEMVEPLSAAPVGGAVIPLPPPPPAPAIQAVAMPATASLAQIIVRLRAGTREAAAALQQMRAGSAELIRLSADMKQQTGELVGQMGVISTALHDFGRAVRKMHEARSPQALH